MPAADRKGQESIMTDRRLCVLNAGSSSLKFGVYTADGGLRLAQSGEVERIGGPGHLRVTAADGRVVHDTTLSVPDHAAALAALAALPDGPLNPAGLIGFGHRVVHGGPSLTAPCCVDATTLPVIEAVMPLAPLHNPPAVKVLKTLAERFPGSAASRVLRHIVPSRPSAGGRPLRHSRRAVSGGRAALRLPRPVLRIHRRRAGGAAPEIALGRVVVAHLGSGASMCALAGGHSVDSSMGFTALDGLPMGTRSGSLDSGVILWLQQQKGWGVDRVEQFLYEECGLKGLSGISNDMRTLLASDAPLAALAVDYFVYHVVQTAGSLAASMGGIDGMVFTAGIGERSPEIRARVLRRLGWLGFSLDEAANQAGGPRLTRADSPRPAYVIPTDEEVVIARHTLALIG